ncbi:uncharacterized protein EDB91DRAFT_1086543 [Suillus paluster]|uniref:uncharacterized protein n=1 Tax=Suillus paluster TaxID=48578 RepID=UPI001B876E52|nr:uncharacterized protein EDB91DRAFT_1086543 [Suillus paluster]KAG1727070.1 hypothetical protein EDB91DRAFT_1086543 [Suillus paluster]
MPHLRILTWDENAYKYNIMTDIDFEGTLEGLARLPNFDIIDSPIPFPELDKLHIIHFTPANAGLFHRLYKQMASIKVLALGPGSLNEYDELVIALLPASHRLVDLPLPRLRTPIIFNVRKDIVWCVVLERLPLAGPLEELYYQNLEEYYKEEQEQEQEQDESVPDDWQDQVEKYYRIGQRSERYCDVVVRQWSYLA